MADVKWIKIATGVFDDDKILLIESLPEADSIIVIWFKLLCLAGKQNNSGVFLMGDKIAYTDKMLATIFRRKEATVQLALQTFEQFGMIEIIDDVITIPNWEKHQSIDQLEKIREQTKARVAKHREKQKLLCNSNITSNVTVTQGNAIDKIREDKNRIDKNIIDESDDSSPAPAKKPVKNKHGEYGNVKLTDSEFEKLASDYGEALRDKAISFLDEYIEEKGYKSKSHNLAIRRWVIDAVKEKEQKGKSARKEIVPEWMKKQKFNDFKQSTSDEQCDDMEKKFRQELDPEYQERVRALKAELQEKYGKKEV